MQKRTHSLIESVTNIAIGIGVAFISQIVFFPLVGIKADLGQNLKITAIFTAVSIIRSYCIRRWFTGWTERG